MVAFALPCRRTNAGDNFVTSIANSSEYHHDFVHGTLCALDMTWRHSDVHEDIHLCWLGHETLEYRLKSKSGLLFHIANLTRLPEVNYEQRLHRRQGRRPCRQRLSRRF